MNSSERAVGRRNFLIGDNTSAEGDFVVHARVRDSHYNIPRGSNWLFFVLVPFGPWRVKFCVPPDGSFSSTETNAQSPAPHPVAPNSAVQTITAAAPYSNSTLHLEADTTLTLLTDGVVEAQNAKGELFGFDRAAEISSKPAQKVAEAAQDFGQQDDITVVTLACTGVPDPAPAPVSA